MFGDAEDVVKHGAGGSSRASSPSTYEDASLSMTMLWDSRLPDSIRSAAEHSQSAAPHQRGVWNEDLAADASASDEQNGEIATTPFSFSQRSLQYQYRNERLPSDQLVNVLSNDKRDSGVGGFDYLLDFAGPNTIGDDLSYNFR